MPRREEVQMKMKWNADTFNELMNILRQHCGETNDNEGAVDTLKRLLREHDCPLKRLS